MITQDLLDFFSVPDYNIKYSSAKAAGTCIKCGNLAQEFRDLSGKLEYKISAFCQNCQDELFLEKH